MLPNLHFDSHCVLAAAQGYFIRPIWFGTTGAGLGWWSSGLRWIRGKATSEPPRYDLKTQGLSYYSLVNLSSTLNRENCSPCSAIIWTIFGSKEESEPHSRYLLPPSVWPLTPSLSSSSL